MGRGGAIGEVGRIASVKRDRVSSVLQAIVRKGNRDIRNTCIPYHEVAVCSDGVAVKVKGIVGLVTAAVEEDQD